MNLNDLTVRLEQKKDYRKTEALVREAFWNVYRPGCLEHYVLNQMRNSSSFIPSLSFVLEKNGEIIGQNVFVHAVIQADNGKKIPIAAMGPICITPSLQRQGYGKHLLDYTLLKAKEQGIQAVCFEGNIAFYGKSGFDYAQKFGIRYHGLPQGADSSFFLCKELTAGYLQDVTGAYTPPACYLVSGAEAEQFDKTFPPKIKQKLASQIF